MVPCDICLRPQQRKMIETDLIIPLGLFGIIAPEKSLLSEEGLLVVSWVFKAEQRVYVEIMNLNQNPTTAIQSFAGDKNIYLKQNDQIAVLFLVS